MTFFKQVSKTVLMSTIGRKKRSLTALIEPGLSYKQSNVLKVPHSQNADTYGVNFLIVGRNIIQYFNVGIIAQFSFNGRVSRGYH